MSLCCGGDFLHRSCISCRGFIELLNEKKKKRKPYCHVHYQANTLKGTPSVYHINTFFLIALCYWMIVNSTSKKKIMADES